MQEISPALILPSQNFLKEKTVRYILGCIEDGRFDELPPTPLVRKDEAGQLVAIDGHNLIAVYLYRDEPINVIVANSSTDGLPPTTEANITRNQELAEKFDTVLVERRNVEKEGINDFFDLINKYPDLFPAVSK